MRTLASLVALDLCAKCITLILTSHVVNVCMMCTEKDNFKKIKCINGSIFLHYAMMKEQCFLLVIQQVQSRC